MSAINVIRQPDRLHVIADSIAYDKDGILTALESKLSVLDHLHAVIGARGTGIGRAIIIPELSEDFYSFDDLIEGVEDWLRDFWMEFCLRYSFADDCPNELTIAGWSRARSRPEVYVIITKDIPQSLYTKTAFQLYEQSHALITRPDVFQDDYDPAVRAGGYDPLTTAGDIDPATHGALLIELQRQRKQLSINVGNVHMVGGEIEMATIIEDGISMRTIGSYPDKLGELLKPEPVDWSAWWGRHNVVPLSPLKRQMLERKQRKALRRA